MTEEPHTPCMPYLPYTPHPYEGAQYEEALARGEEVDLRPEKGARVDAAGGEEWGEGRKVEAALLARLLTEPAGLTGTHRALWLAGAHILGTLDLSAALLTRPLHLEDCYFGHEKPILLNDARAISVRLPGCHVRGLQGRAMRAQGDLCLGDGFTATGEIELQGAQIQGTVDCDRGTFRNPSKKALDASRLVVDGSLWFVGAELTGGVKLIGAQIGAQFNCTGATFDNGDATDDELVALEAYGLDVKGSMFLRDHFTALGEIRMSRARIGGDLDCSQGTFVKKKKDAQAKAFDLYGAFVNGTMRCRKKFKAVGEIRMRGARIGGDLDFSDSSLAKGPEGGKALDAERLTVDGTMKCSDGFVATGEVDLTGARIGGDLECCEGTFSNAALGAKALDAKRLTVEGTVKFSTGFTARGGVDLAGARVGGDLDCRLSTFTDAAESGNSLDAKRLTVEGSMKCSYGFSATGEVDLSGAHIGELDCSQGLFTTARTDGCSITLMNAEVSREVLFLPEGLTGFVDLRSAKVGRWFDSSTTWRGSNTIRMNGFTYTCIDSQERKMTVRERLDWIGRDTEGFVPQPYRQLADVYQREGSERDARKVRIAAQWRRRNNTKTSIDRRLRGVRMVWKSILRATIGFGYQPWLILLPIAVLYSFGSYWFSRAHEHHDIIRAKSVGADVHFNGAIYTADLLIPGANLGERARFLATDGTAIWAASYTLAGWALAAMLIAGLTGVFKKL
ncbi:hypothetical protein [Streptomyces sp. NPDC048436]|uniref:hypothetical protein n=1 Tax=Streptomyces sp. NPDC048436 TaxID=3365550 RepID=UPI003716D0FC